MIMSNLSVNDFVKSTKRKSKAPKNNIHVIVSGYERDDNGVAYAVKGKNMLTGENVKVRLATVEEYARFFTKSDSYMNVRLDHAKQALRNRPEISDFGALRKARGVPENGVITFSDIRVDDDGTIIGRWPNTVIIDPDIEAALLCDYQVRTRLVNEGTADQKTTAFILAMFSREAVSSEDITREKLDHMLSGRLLDTQSPMQTNVTTVVDFGDGMGTFTFFPNQIKETKTVLKDGHNTDVNVYRSPQGLEESILNKVIRNPTIMAAAVAIAAKAGIPFDDIPADYDILEQIEAEARNTKEEDEEIDIRGKYKDLYDSVKDGTYKVVFIPGASLYATKFASQAILGLKDDGNGNMKETITNESRLKGAGYVSGVLGIRHISAGTEKPIQATVKSLYTDSFILDQNDINFVRRGARDVGQEIFKKIYGDAPSSQINANTTPQHDTDDEPQYGSDEEPSF